MLVMGPTVKKMQVHHENGRHSDGAEAVQRPSAGLERSGSYLCSVGVLSRWWSC